MFFNDFLDCLALQRDIEFRECRRRRRNALNLRMCGLRRELL